MKTVPFCLPSVLFILLVTFLCSCSSGASLYGPSPDQRRVALETVAGYKHLGFQVVAARLDLGVDTELAWRQLDTLLEKPTGDIFWMYPAVAFYFNMRNELDDQWRNRFRDVWKHYTPYRGDTENHFLMYYGSLYLMSQEWPDLPGDAWFNGKSSKEIHAEAAGYLDTWIDETVRHGLTEWDSPRYLYYYITPLLTLRDFTKDPRMQKRFSMLIEYMLADFAAEYLNGNYCGAHSRDGDGSVIDPRRAEATSYAQFYFEDSLDFVLPDLAYAAMSSFSAPEIIRQIAHDRGSAFIHTELKRSRAKMRNAAEKYTPVYKYTYMTPTYCLGSIQGGLQQPIQQHTWDLTFAAEKPNNTIFTIHPQASAHELAMFFPEEPELMEEGILASKASYGNPDKWIGGSPFEEVHQQGGTLLALYYLDPDWRFPHVDLFLPKSLDTMVRDTSGWIFTRMGGAYAAIRPFDPDARWIEESINWRVRTTQLNTGFVIETAQAKDMTFESFMEMLRPLVVKRRGEAGDLGPDVWYKTMREQTLTVLPGNSPGEGVMLVDGRLPIGRKNRPLFDGPHLSSPPEGGILEMHYNGRTRILDFVRNEVRETTEAK